MAKITALTMPKFGLAMTEGMVAAWHKQPGETVRQGEEIADIETSKITSAYESPAAGVLRRQVLAPGEMVPVGALIGVIAEPEATEAEIDAFIAEFLAKFEAERTEAETEATANPERVETPAGLVQYLAAGPADAPAIVFIHGFGGDLNNWMFLQPLLAERFRTVALDLPGHGGSTKALKQADPAALARFVLATMDALGIGAAHVVGHSMGGAVAIAIAQEASDRALSLSLISPAGLGSDINADFIRGFIEAKRARQLAAVLQSLFADPALVGREMVENVLRFKRLDGVEAALRTLADAHFPDGRQAFALREALARFPGPVQVIWGVQDQIIPPAHAEGLAEAVRVHRFENVGHMAHMERATEVARLIAELAGGR
ncbi:MAG: acetoin dehydrogenase dihydrolipoyllysine-residue acetyltransferase subunit [Acidobacteriia bacterium]|nr:acetoin dehydrogenase dihydrolipoyllysine-residue acetyltransferase subunit [Methyloceanibacter sp.]MCL6491991.1 acetoin dehydrogenase dihydrolipoyllysine-residue acetyltransferase subunit [Terriglobia bacterium]